jgi:DNA-binding transcriptional ArsR family regulator
MTEVLDNNTIKALAVEQRQKIMKLLAKRPYTASEIAKITSKHVTTITQHLDVLERSGLIKKKDSSNKWVYYTLSDRGERLFKPQFYSWVIVFSISIVLMSIGMLRLFSPIDYEMAQTSGIGTVEKAIAPTVTSPEEALYGTTIANETVNETVSLPAQSPDSIAISLITLGIGGIAFVAYSKVTGKP